MGRSSIARLEAVAACLFIGIAAAVPFAGHAHLVSRFDVALVPLGCDLNDFPCSTSHPSFWTPIVALAISGGLFGAVAAGRLSRSFERRILAFLAGGVTFVGGALVTQATVGDNPLAMAINDLLGTATLDTAPVWADIARQFGLSVFVVAAAFSLAVGLVVRPRRAPAAGLLGGLTAGIAFAATTWLLDQVLGVNIVAVDGASEMPRVALTSNLVAGIAGSAVALAILTGRPARLAAAAVVHSAATAEPGPGPS